MDAWKGRLFVAVGGLMLVIGAWTAISEALFVRGAVVADGVVIRQNHGPAHVQVGFKMQDGQDISFMQNGRISYQVGDKVKVLYDPSNPKRVHEVDDPGALWFSSAVPGGLGLVFVLVGGGFRRRREAA